MSTPKAQFAEEQTADGEFVRQEDAFRDGPGQDRDPVESFRYLSEAYLSTPSRLPRPLDRSRALGKATHRIVNNSEDDICRMFNSVFAPKHPPPDLFPETVAAEQTALSTRIYETVNNGVYRAGFASSQAAHGRAVRTLFAALDELDARLADRRHLLRTPEPVETDWRFFCTLVRFDAVYHGHFKCNLRRIADYPNLHGYLRDLYQRDGVAATVGFDHIKRHYYLTHTEINPSRIVPLGPLLDLRRPHSRERLR